MQTRNEHGQPPAWLCRGCRGLALLLGARDLNAAPLLEKDVRLAVQTWVRQVTADARPDAVIAKLEPYAVRDGTVGYVAQLEGGGYCLCGADDRLLPVYLYCPLGEFDSKDPNNHQVFGEMSARLDALQQGAARRDASLKSYVDELSRRASFWEALISGRPPPARRAPKDGSGAPERVVLPLTCHWHQDSPYNDECPNLTPGQDERTVVGCVATAMAQIMYYWQWPPAGIGAVPTPYPFKYRFTTAWLTEPLSTDPQVPASWNARLRWDNSNGGTLWMNGYWDEASVYPSAVRISTNTTYRTALAALWNRMTAAQSVPSVNFSAPILWNVITNTHTDPVDAGDTAVAELCRAAGVSVYMKYGIFGSDALSHHLAEALETYFRFDPDALYATSADLAKMVEEIQWYRVVEIGGGGPPPVAGGHAWLIHGYNQGTTPTQLLMNLGWGAANSAWYSLDQVFPAGQDMTIRIAPLNVVKFVGAAVSGTGSPVAPYRDIEHALANAPDGATLVFKAGSDNTFTAPMLRISRPLTLKGAGATIH